MKKITAAIFLAPAIGFAQESGNSFGASGGFEFQDTKTLAWNIQTNFNRTFQKNERWSTEYGANFYVLEHRHNENYAIPQDSTSTYLAYGTIIYPGYAEFNEVHYSKTNGIRLQAGINYAIVKKKNFTFSAGLNVVNDVLLDYKEHGQRFLVPVAGYGDTLEYRTYHYSTHRKTSAINNAVSLQIQPHIDCFIPITQKLVLTARLGYYIQMAREIQFIRPQSNLGIAYCW